MPDSPRVSYASILSRPHVAAVFVPALLGRLSYPLLSLPLLLAVHEGTGSYAVAGTAVAGYGATAAFLAPLRAKTIDRFGQRTMLPVLALVFAGFLLLLAALCAAGISAWLAVLTASLIGSFAPPLGPVMRVLWKELTDGPDMLRRALTLDAVIEEVLFLLGPAVAGLLITALPASAVLVLPAALVLAGTLAMLPSRILSHRLGVGSSAANAMSSHKLVRSRSFLGLLVPVLGVGGALGIVYVAVPAFGSAEGSASAAGLILSAFAAGSAGGGLLYGRVTLNSTPQKQLRLLTLGLALGVTGMAFAPGTMALGLIAAFTGLFLSPAMITAYLAASNIGTDRQATEVNTWVNTAQNLGAAAGSAVAGFLIEADGITVAFLAAGATAAVLAGVGSLLMHQGRS